jgi:hypothetical protein
MMSKLYRLVYVSTARDDLSDVDIASILDTSQSNNHERYLTGFLVHNGKQFMQALEGEEAEVRGIYQCILNDKRHTGIIQILGERTSDRAFPEWAMNYYRVDEPGSAAMVARRDDPVDGLLPQDMPRELLHMFSRFMRIESLVS